MPERSLTTAFVPLLYRNASGVWSQQLVPLTQFLGLNPTELAARIESIPTTDSLPLTQYSAVASVTQLTSKSTGVTLNRPSGLIVLNNANLAADTTVSFTLTNSTIAAGDAIWPWHSSVGTFGAYVLNGRCAAGSATIDVHNATPAGLAEAIVIGFEVSKPTTA